MKAAQDNPDRKTRTRKTNASHNEIKMKDGERGTAIMYILHPVYYKVHPATYSRSCELTLIFSWLRRCMTG